jgi:hypothetical protein
MSVKLLLGDLSNNEKKYIEKTLTITCDNQDVNVFEVVTDQLFLPFSFARNLNNAFNNASVQQVVLEILYLEIIYLRFQIIQVLILEVH